MSGKQQLLIAGGAAVLFIGIVVVIGLLGDADRQPFDPSEWLPKTLEIAKKEQPTAAMIEATATRVAPDGLVQVHERHAALTVRFRYTGAPLADPVPAPMLGASYTAPAGGCSGGEVTVGDTGPSRHYVFTHEWEARNQKCLPTIDHLPRCTFKQIWQKAKAKGAPEHAYADIDLALEAGSGVSELRWRFEVVDRPMDGPEHIVFHAEFADDC